MMETLRALVSDFMEISFQALKGVLKFYQRKLKFFVLKSKYLM